MKPFSEEASSVFSRWCNGAVSIAAACGLGSAFLASSLFLFPLGLLITFLLSSMFALPPVLRFLGLAPRGRRPLSNLEALKAHPVPPDSTSRAHEAYDSAQPNGSVEGVRKDHSVIQQHVDFFDADGDGIIWPIDTYIGFRRIGFGRAFSLLAAVLVNGSMSFATWPNWIPRVGFPIFVERFHRTKHGSDAGVFDGEGRFSGPAFEAIFSKHATAKDESGLPALSREDISDLLHTNLDANDVAGALTARFEWLSFYYIAKDEKGLVTKERMRQMYDGSLWMQLDAEATKRRGREVWPRKQRRARPAEEAPPPSEEKSPGKAKRASMGPSQAEEKAAAAAHQDKQKGA